MFRGRCCEPVPPEAEVVLGAVVLRNTLREEPLIESCRSEVSFAHSGKKEKRKEGRRNESHSKPGWLGNEDKCAHRCSCGVSALLMHPVQTETTQIGKGKPVHPAALHSILYWGMGHATPYKAKRFWSTMQPMKWPSLKRKQQQQELRTR